MSDLTPDDLTPDSMILDGFEDLCGWTAIAPGQARLAISPGQGRRGAAMRLDFDFHGGGGFVVARKAFDLSLPESYRFSLGIRGQGPSNSLEFKLVDATNQNVWRWREESFRLPETWQRLQIKSTQLPFAWGPLGGGPARTVAAIELVIAAGPGGSGTLWVDDLRLEDTSYYLTPKFEASSALQGYPAAHVWVPSPDTCWRSAETDAPQHLLIDFRREREFGGLIIHWDPKRRPRALDLRLSGDGDRWEHGFCAHQGVAEVTHAYLPGACSRFIRLDLRPAAGGRGIGVVRLEVQPPEVSCSINDFFTAIAERARPGAYPKYLLKRQTYWTPVGTGEDLTQGLINEEGLVEVDKGAFSIEPFLFAEGRFITWADAKIHQTLERGYLPVPTSHWQVDALRLDTTAYATGPCGDSTLFIRYRLRNDSDLEHPLSLFAAIRPFQVTPTWQHWQGFGGLTPIGVLEYRDGRPWVDGRKQVVPLSPVAGFGAAGFAQGAITDFLEAGTLPPQDRVEDPFGYASGALRFDLKIPPRSVCEVCLAVPFGESLGPQEPGGTETAWHPVEGFEAALKAWEERLGSFEVRLPGRAPAGLVETLKTAAAHVLINRDGPALQPGPRRYSRSWIRDGALMAAALARVGIAEAGRDFARWYADFQAPDGNLPDCVDRDGTEWLPEFDSWGQLIFATMDHFRFSGDRTFLAEMWGAVLKSVDYLERLMGQRLTPEFQAPDKRAFYGLLPESMSHEGYMAHPVHAYWDDFWALRGLKDGAEMAEILGHDAQARRITHLSGSLARNLYASLNRVIQGRGLDYVPGCVELADFDPSATSIALTVADELHHLPRPAIDQTFDKYLAGFRARARGETPWANYSAYEIRIIGALVRLGRRQEAHELLEFFLADRRIQPWNQWPEISWRDPLGPSFIGDMPHSWIGAEYILAARSLFAYEREADRSLVIAAGIPAGWLSEAGEVEVHDLPTYYGPVSYRLARRGENGLRLSLAGDLRIPPGGILVMPPFPGVLSEVRIDGRYGAAFGADWVRCPGCPAELELHC